MSRTRLIFRTCSLSLVSFIVFSLSASYTSWLLWRVFLPGGPCIRVKEKFPAFFTASSCPGLRCRVVFMSSFLCPLSIGARARYLGMFLRKKTLLISSVASPRRLTALIIRRNESPCSMTSILHSHDVWFKSSTEKLSGWSTKSIWITSLSSRLSTCVTQQWTIQGKAWHRRHRKSPVESLSPRATHKILERVNSPTSAIN